MPHGEAQSKTETEAKTSVHSEEFKREAVKLVYDQQLSVAEAARNLGIHPNLLRSWKRRIEAENEETVTHGGRTDGDGTAASRESSAANGARHIKKSGGLLRERKELRFDFIEKHREEWPVKVMCEVLEVSRSGFYAWRSRPESERSKHHRELVAEVKKIHDDRDMKFYGSPRVHGELVARGKACSQNTVARLMRAHGLAAKNEEKVPSHHRLGAFASCGGKRAESRV